jgi:hypothetical protein
METGQVFLIQTEGPDGLQSTEVVITDLGEIGEDAIVVFEAAAVLGVGAEETVVGGSSNSSFGSSCSSSSNGSFDSCGGPEEILSDDYLETSNDCLEVPVPEISNLPYAAGREGVIVMHVGETVQ